MWLAIKLALSSIWAFLLPSLKIYATTQGIAMANSARKAVKYAFSVEGTGTDKRKAAVKYVMDDLKAMNITIHTIPDIAKNMMYDAVVKAYTAEYGDKAE